MSDRIVIIYDCPLKKCDKLWLLEELSGRGYTVKTVTALCRISNVEQRGRLGKAAARLLTLWQSMKGLLKSRRGDTVICWSQWSGLFFNLLPGAERRNIISYNWLTPVPNERTRKLYAKALQNRRLTAVINSPETKERLLEAYRVEDKGNIVYIPDVFDDRERFSEPVYNRERKYCFSGGRANRDWSLLMELAKACPDIAFEFVAVKADWKDNMTVPVNVQLHFDLEPESYYRLLEDSYMAVFPLKENRVSGLINILKAVQKGKPVLTTRIAAAGIYFPEEYQNCLLPFGDLTAWKAMTDRLWNCREDQYASQVKGMRDHIRASFSPRTAGQRIHEIIQQYR